MIIYDTAGQERFRSAALQGIRYAHGVIIIFDVTRRSSFDHINIWIEDIETYFGKPNLVLFGNRADVDKKEWKVTNEEVKSLEQKYILPLKWWKVPIGDIIAD